MPFKRSKKYPPRGRLIKVFHAGGAPMLSAIFATDCKDDPESGKNGADDHELLQTQAALEEILDRAQSLCG